MDFPVAELLDDELSEQWLLKHFHPKGLKCPHCVARPSRARAFRRTRRSQVTVYRCHECQGLWNAYSGTVFQARHLRPSQVVLLLRGVCKGEPTPGWRASWVCRAQRCMGCAGNSNKTPRSCSPARHCRMT
jgi:hypothetical protein